MEPNFNEGAPVDLTLLPVSNPLQHVLGSHICGGLEVEGNWTRNSFFISSAHGEHNLDWASTWTWSYLWLDATDDDYRICM